MRFHSLLLLCLCGTLLGFPLPGSAAEGGGGPAEAPAGPREDDLDKAEEKEGTPLPEVKLPDMVITAGRRMARLFELPNTVQVYGSDAVSMQKLFRTVPEIFSEDPSVNVQKTSYGMGSPYLRGFTGFRCLFLVDGIRLNNAIFREGPNQYWNTVDPYLIDRLEAVKGLSSVLYGSDAIGGTVNALSKRNTRFQPGFGMGGGYGMRLAIPDLSVIERVDLNLNSGEAFGFHIGGTYKDFHDFRAGEHVGIVRKSGYEEWNVDMRAEYFFAPEIKIVAAYQHTDQDDSWRTHKTIYSKTWHGTSPGNELERSWDHWRDLGYLQLHAEKLSDVLRAVRLNLSVHHQKEERYRVKSSGSADINMVDVLTPAFWGTAEFETPAGIITAGAEFYYDRVLSSKDKYNADGSFNSSGIQGPVADHASYDMLGLFLQDEFLMLDPFRFMAGLRYSWVRVIASRVQDPNTGDRIRLRDSYDSLTVNLRGALVFKEDANIFFGLATGFRAPNLSDLTRLDTARSNEIETPSPGLEPEHFTTFEVGLKARIGERLTLEGAYYYTLIEDMIIRYPTGNVIAGDNEVQKANAGDGWMTGIEAWGAYRLLDDLELRAGFSAAQGKLDTYPTSAMVKEREWMSRVPPLSGFLTARYTHPSKRGWAEVTWKGAWRQRKLSTRDEGDTQRIPPGGTPGYGVVHLRGGFKVDKNITLSAMIQNLFNKEYRVHGSGQNEPGIGLRLAFEVKFWGAAAGRSRLGVSQ
jgi:hemoglobin/transferrin/lactoferrin receptor protein